MKLNMEWKTISRYLLYAGIFLITAIWIPSWFLRNDTFAGAGFLGYPARLHTEQAVVFLTIPLLLLIREDRAVFRNFLMILAVVVFTTSFIPYRPAFYAPVIIFYALFFFFPSGRILEKRPAGQLLWLGIGAAIGGFLFFLTALVTQKAGLYILGRNWLYYGTLILIPVGTYLNSIQITRKEKSFAQKIDTLAIWVFGFTLAIEALYRIGASRDVPGGMMDFVRGFIVIWWVYSAVNHSRSLPAILSGSFLVAGIFGHAVFPAMGTNFAHLTYLGGIVPYTLLAIARLSGVSPVGGVIVPYLFMASGLVRVLAGLQERIVFFPVFISAFVALLGLSLLIFAELKRNERTGIN